MASACCWLWLVSATSPSRTASPEPSDVPPPPAPRLALVRPTVFRNAFSRAASSLAALAFDLGAAGRDIRLLRLIGRRLILKQLTSLQALRLAQHLLGMLLLIGRFLLAGGQLLSFESQRVGLLLSVKLSRVAGSPAV